MTPIETAIISKGITRTGNTLAIIFLTTRRDFSSTFAAFHRPHARKIDMSMHRIISPNARYRNGYSMYCSCCSDSIVRTLIALLKMRYAKNPSPASSPIMVTITINFEITFIST